MNGKRKKGTALGALLALLGLMWAGPAAADSNPADDRDSLTITVSPDVNYSLDITTTDAIVALGAVSLGASTQTVHPATVTFGGTVLSGHELKLSAAITAAGTAWGFDATPSTGANTLADPDKLAMYALFSSTRLATAPAGDTFGDPAAGTNPPTTDATVDDGDGDSTVTSVWAGGGTVGGASATGTKFEYHENAGINAGDKDMDNNTTGSANAGGINNGVAHLWFWLRLPSASTDGNTQSIAVTLTHTLGDL